MHLSPPRRRFTRGPPGGLGVMLDYLFLPMVIWLIDRSYLTAQFSEYGRRRLDRGLDRNHHAAEHPRIKVADNPYAG